MFEQERARKVIHKRFNNVIKETIKELHAHKERESLMLFIEEVQKHLKPDVAHLTFPEIVELTVEQAVKLQKQESILPSFPYELIEQWAEYGCEDCFAGNMYYPITDTKFIKIEYQC